METGRISEAIIEEISAVIPYRNSGEISRGIFYEFLEEFFDESLEGRLEKSQGIPDRVLGRSPWEILWKETPGGIPEILAWVIGGWFRAIARGMPRKFKDVNSRGS